MAMKKTGFVAIMCVIMLSTSSCDWFRSRLGMPTSQELAAAKEKARQDSIQKADYARLQEENRQRQRDSILQAQAAKPALQRYHVVFGCFMVPDNANRLMQNLTRAGLTPQNIAFKNGFNVISAAAYDKLGDAYNGMNQLMSASSLAPYNIWIYDTRQQLHLE
jgi:hypothetical protein